MPFVVSLDSMTLAFLTPTALPRPSNRDVKLCTSVRRGTKMSHPTEADAQAIAKCVQLARKAVGQTRPNPPVGCIIQSPDGSVLGTGYHRRAGGPHAEAAALSDAKERGNSTVGATAYVSLEPCNHYGRTPPCSQALLKAGVSRVVIGMSDPNPTAGGGAHTLREGGVDVLVGVGERECTELLEGFISRVRRKLPFGVLKYAMSIDGKIATESGSSKWVTGEAARGRVHAIRRGTDAIIVGGNTLRLDDPRLTVRDGCSQKDDLQPIRVVMTKNMQLPLDARLWNDAQTIETIVMTDAAHTEQNRVRALRAKGVHVVETAGLTPEDTMGYLYERDCLNVLWECGGGLGASAIRHGAVQKVHAFVAPKIVGGNTAASPVGSPAVAEDMKDALVLQRRTVETFENGDLLMTGYLQ